MDFKQPEFVYDSKQYFGKTFMTDDQISSTVTLLTSSSTNLFTIIVTAIKLAALFALYWIWKNQQENKLAIDRQNFYSTLHQTHKDELD
jgi:hypothetical protein